MLLEAFPKMAQQKPMAGNSCIAQQKCTTCADAVPQIFVCSAMINPYRSPNWSDNRQLTEGSYVAWTLSKSLRTMKTIHYELDTIRDAGWVS